MSDDDAPLEGRELLDLARGGLGPRPSDRARLKRTVLAATAAGAVTAGAASAQAASAVGTGLVLSTGVKLAIAAAVIGVASLGAVSLGAIPTTPETRAPAVRTATRPAPEPLVVVPPPTAPSAPTNAEVAPVAEPPPEIVAEPIRRIEGTTRPGPVDDEDDHVGSIVDESRLLARAQAAVDRGDGSAALAALDEHARRFPDGTMAEERAAVRVLALSLAGDADRTCRAAEAFLHAHPSSVHASRVRATCPAE